MHYDRLRARVLAAVRSSPTGVALVFPDGEGAWVAQYKNPPQTAVLRTQELAALHIRRNTPQQTPIIIKVINQLLGLIDFQKCAVKRCFNRYAFFSCRSGNEHINFPPSSAQQGAFAACLQ